MRDFKEKGMRFLFFLAACICVAAVVLICIFLFASGISSDQGNRSF